MKIGLVRHYRVDCKMKKLMNSTEFEEYAKSYDISPIIKNEVILDYTKWDKCYCSDLKRAVITAESIYKGNIIITELLREVPWYPVFKSRIKLPSFYWRISSRIAWKKNRNSQKETALDTVKRAKLFVDSIDLDSDENILIVAHGFFFITLIKELRKKRFSGKIPIQMKNGQVYILEK